MQLLVHDPHTTVRNEEAYIQAFSSNFEAFAAKIVKSSKLKALRYIFYLCGQCVIPLCDNNVVVYSFTQTSIQENI